MHCSEHFFFCKTGLKAGKLIAGFPNRRKGRPSLWGGQQLAVKSYQKVVLFGWMVIKVWPSIRSTWGLIRMYLPHARQTELEVPGVAPQSLRSTDLNGFAIGSGSPIGFAGTGAGLSGNASPSLRLVPNTTTWADVYTKMAIFNVRLTVEVFLCRACKALLLCWHSPSFDHWT